MLLVSANFQPIHKRNFCLGVIKTPKLLLYLIIQTSNVFMLSCFSRRVSYIVLANSVMQALECGPRANTDVQWHCLHTKKRIALSIRRDPEAHFIFAGSTPLSRPHRDVANHSLPKFDSTSISQFHHPQHSQLMIFANHHGCHQASSHA